MSSINSTRKKNMLATKKNEKKKVGCYFIISPLG